MNFSSPSGSVFSCPGWWKRVNAELHRSIVGDGLYLKAQWMRRAALFNLVQMENLPTSTGQLFNGVTQRNTVNRSTEVKIEMLVHESRILQVTLFGTLK